MKLFKNPLQSPESARKLQRGTLTALVIAAVLVINIILGYIVNSYGLYFYQAEYEEDFTISGMTDGLFADAIAADREITITFCLDEDELEAHSTGSFVLETARQFDERYGDFVNLEFVNVLTKLNSRGERVDLEKYTTDMQGNETTLNRTSVIFSSGDNYRVLTNVYNSVGFVDFYTFDAEGNIASFNGETVIASTMAWVLRNEHGTAYVTVNHGEESDAAFATLLSTAGYYVKTVNLQDTDVPEDAELLVISNPKNDFERAADGSSVHTEIERLTSYVNRGGNIYVSLDPYVNKLTNLEGWLAEHGIAFSETEVDGKLLRNIVRDPSNAITTDGYTLIAEYADTETAALIENKAGMYSDGGIILREASALSLSGNAQALLVSSPSSVSEVGGAVTDNAGSFPIAAAVKVPIEDSENVARIFVIPSIYISASDALISNSYSNRDFLYSLFEQFYGAEQMPYGTNSVTYVSDDLKNLTMGTAKIYTAILLAIPCITAIAGAAVIIRRKNR